MSNPEFNTGVELASGKAKGAVGVVETIKMCLSTIKHSKFDESGRHCFTRESARTIERLLDVIEAVWGMVHNRALSAEYTMVETAADQRLLFGNVWIEIGNYHAVSLHWEALSECTRSVIETAVLSSSGRGQSSVITREPVRFELSEEGANKLTDWITTMIYAVGNGLPICQETCPDFPDRGRQEVVE